MLAQLRQLSPSTGGWLCPPMPAGTPLHGRAGLDEQEPRRAAPPTRARIRRAVGLRMRRRRKGQPSASMCRLLRRGCCIVAAGTPPLPCAGQAPACRDIVPAGNSHWQRALTRPGAPWGHRGTWAPEGTSAGCAPHARGCRAPHTAPGQG